MLYSDDLDDDSDDDSEDDSEDNLEDILEETGRLKESKLENINYYVTDLLKLHHKMVYFPPVKDEPTFKFPEMVKLHLLYSEHVINFGKEYEVIGSVAEQNMESSHKTFNKLKRKIYMY